LIAWHFLGTLLSTLLYIWPFLRPIVTSNIFSPVSDNFTKNQYIPGFLSIKLIFSSKIDPTYCITWRWRRIIFMLLQLKIQTDQAPDVGNNWFRSLHTTYVEKWKCYFSFFTKMRNLCLKAQIFREISPFLQKYSRKSREYFWTIFARKSFCQEVSTFQSCVKVRNIIILVSWQYQYVLIFFSYLFWTSRSELKPYRFVAQAHQNDGVWLRLHNPCRHIVAKRQLRILGKIRAFLWK
jgi:hypothetical protein